MSCDPDRRKEATILPQSGLGISFLSIIQSGRSWGSASLSGSGFLATALLASVHRPCEAKKYEDCKAENRSKHCARYLPCVA